MNPTLTISAQNTGNIKENNSLPLSVETGNGLSKQPFEDDFSKVLEDSVPSDGKIKPLDIATLKDLGFQDPADLEKLEESGLAADPSQLNQLSLLSLLANVPETKIENAELFGNPDIQTSLISNHIYNQFTEEDLLLAKGSKPAFLKSNSQVRDALQLPVTGQNANLSHTLDDMNLAQFTKYINHADVDLSSRVLSSSAHHESQTTKLFDQLTNIDKSINPLNQLNTSSLKSDTGPEHTAKLMSRIEVPVNQSGWGEAVGHRLMMMVNGKIQSANIHLNPAELGPIEIRVKLNHEHATVHFISSNTTVRSAIEDTFPDLKEMFSQNGLSLADANVSQQSSHQTPQNDKNFYDEHNGSMFPSINESIESSDVQNIDAKWIDIGFINHYV